MSTGTLGGFRELPSPEKNPLQGQGGNSTVGHLLSKHEVPKLCLGGGQRLPWEGQEKVRAGVGDVATLIGMYENVIMTPLFRVPPKANFES